MIIYNGLFQLYSEERTGNSKIKIENNENENIPKKPTTICPFSHSLTFIVHNQNILEIKTKIRDIVLAFANENDLNLVINTLKTCEQFNRQPISIKVKDYKSGYLAYLQYYLH